MKAFLSALVLLGLAACAPACDHVAVANSFAFSSAVVVPQPVFVSNVFVRSAFVPSVIVQPAFVANVAVVRQRAIVVAPVRQKTVVRQRTVIRSR